MISYKEGCDFWLDIWKDDYGRRMSTTGYKRTSQRVVNTLAPYLTEVESFCELGMGNGRNIHYFHEQFSNWGFRGNDINPDTYSEMALYFPKVIDYVSVIILDTLEYLRECKQVDLIFTFGHLMHIPDDSIKEVCELMSNKADKYIATYEAFGHQQWVSRPRLEGFRFERDYQKIFDLEVLFSGHALGQSSGLIQNLCLFKK